MPSKNHVSLNSTPYPFVWWWGKHTETAPHFIRQREAQAIEENAPEGAINRDAEGDWSLVTDLRNADAIAALQADAPELYNRAVELAIEKDDKAFIQLAGGAK